MNKLEAVAHLHKMSWHFAKSMPKIPHWYARRREFSSYTVFVEVARFIKENGKPEAFYSKTYNYINDDEYKYWIMDDDYNDAEIINRASL